MVKKWSFLLVFASLILIPLLGYAGESSAVSSGDRSVKEEDTEEGKVFVQTTEFKYGKPSEGEKVHTAGVFMDFVTSDGVPVEMSLEVKYYREGSVEDFVLSVDEAGDRASGTVFVAYREAVKSFHSSTLRSEKGLTALIVRAWFMIGIVNILDFEPKVVGINFKKITFNPDPESLGRPTMFFIDEESGDAEAGI